MLRHILRAERVILGLRAADKPRLLEELARRASRDLPLPAATILAALVERERLGSTGLGKGFGLPHIRLAGLAEPFGMLVRLARAIEYQAIDAKPVDVVFLLMLPEAKPDTHVAALATVARLMRNPAALALIRKTDAAAPLYGGLAALAESDQG